MKRQNHRVIVSILCGLVVLGTACATAPKLHRERIEWCNIWFTNAEKNDLPRVLLIGDSITQGYFPPTEKLIGDTANCGRMTTSRSVCDPVLYKELSLVLGQYDYAVIHVNNGLHGWSYSEDEYRAGLEKFIRFLKKKAPGARLVFASSTPVQSHSSMKDNAHRVALRNQIAEEIMAAEDIPVDDLYSLVTGHDEYYSKDGVHFIDSGKNAQAEQVVGIVLGMIEKR